MIGYSKTIKRLARQIVELKSQRNELLGLVKEYLHLYEDGGIDYEYEEFEKIVTVLNTKMKQLVAKIEGDKQ